MIVCTKLIHILFVLQSHPVKQMPCKSYHGSKILFTHQGNGKETQQSVSKIVYTCVEKSDFTKSKLEERYPLPLFKKGSWMEKIKNPQPPFQNYAHLNIDCTLVEGMSFFPYSLWLSYLKCFGVLVHSVWKYLLFSHQASYCCRTISHFPHLFCPLSLPNTS